MKEKISTPGDRLKEEITRVFGSYKKAADAIGAKSGSYFRPYLNNTNGIGMLLRKKLADIGLDVEYIINGVRAEDSKELSDIDDDLVRKVQDLRYRSEQLNKEIAEIAELVIRRNKSK
jgi:hypothetical protein